MMKPFQAVRAGVLAAIAVAGAPSSALAAAQPPPTPPAPTALVPGDNVPPFDAEGLDGVVKHVTFPQGSHTVILFFLSSCPTCHRMIPLWNDAFERRSPRLNVVAVLLDKEPPGFFMATPVAFPVVRSPGKQLLSAYKIARVPVTLRVGAGGKVEDVGSGHLDGIRLGELFHP